jgi:transcriptional regulator with XRE-family HTH domain
VTPGWAYTAVTGGRSIVDTEGSEFGAQIRRLREAAGLTQEELAERAGMTASGVSALERGHRRRPYAHTVRSLATALALPEADRNALFAATRHPSSSLAQSAPAAMRGNLPLQLTSFIGREHELADLGHQVGTTRLLTMTGPGGVGKTRLALEVAADLAIDFPDGVWFVDLAPVAHPDLVPQTTATTLGLLEEPGQPIVATLTSAVRSKHLLLILDNPAGQVCRAGRLAHSRVSAHLDSGDESRSAQHRGRNCLAGFAAGITGPGSLRTP